MKRKNPVVLIIDDDAVTLKITRAALPVSEFDVKTMLVTGSSNEMIQEAVKVAPDLIVLDLHMPQASGFALLKKQRDDSTFLPCPVMVLSGDKTRSSVSLALSLGATDYALKPVPPETLLAKVRRCLKSAQAREVKFVNALKVQVSTNAVISKINETGLVIEAPVKLGKGTPIQINSKFLRESGLGDCVFQKTGNPAKFVQGDQFINEISMLGIPSRGKR